MITYSDGATRSTVDFIEQNISRLGSIKSVSHNRNGRKVFYETTIDGERDTLVITGGITSGYIGEGPSGLLKVLKLIGVPEEEARNLVYENTEEKHSFTYKL